MTSDKQNELDVPENGRSATGWGIGCGCLGVIAGLLLAITFWIIGGTVIASVLFLAPLEFSGFLEDSGDPFVVIMSIVTVILLILGGVAGYFGGIALAAMLKRD